MSSRFRLCLVVSLLLVSGGAAYGQGLQGEYFPNNLLMTGQPALTRIEIVNFNWGANSPGDPIGVDTFSARWTGSLTPPETGEYIFATRTD